MNLYTIVNEANESHICRKRINYLKNSYPPFEAILYKYATHSVNLLLDFVCFFVWPYTDNRYGRIVCHGSMLNVFVPRGELLMNLLKVLKNIEKISVHISADTKMSN